MGELIVLALIGIGLYKRGGRRFEWSRRSVRSALAGLHAGATRFLVRGLRSTPGIVGQCIVDMRSLVDDALGLIDPKTRKRIKVGARKALSRAEQRARAGGVATARLATAQKSYLDGSITLERYVEETERLTSPR